MQDDRARLRQTIKTLDRWLDKNSINTITLGEAHGVLRQIETFYETVATLQNTQPDAPSEVAETDLSLDYLTTVGCRICADLNELVLLRIMDLSQTAEHDAQWLYAQLRDNLRTRHQSAQLLHNAQRLRTLSVNTTDTLGLGVIL
jgi:hypothetical protein